MKCRSIAFGFGAAAMTAAMAVSAQAAPELSGDAASPCTALLGAALGSGKVEVAQDIAAGEMVVVGGAKAPAPVAFCRVQARFKPSAHSDIRAEFWLPRPKAWNGKFLGVGNGGFGGNLDNTATLYVPLRQGYAGGASDMGHSGTVVDGGWAADSDKLTDWAERANHVTAEGGKQLVRLYYGAAAKRSYFHGCSDGGREALMEAWRHPDDYDGIIAGAPAANFTGMAAQFIWIERAVAGVGLNPSKLKLLSNSVLAQCDAADGVKDGVVGLPQACRFDPGVLQCKSGESEACLTEGQVSAIRAIYAGPKSQSGVQISRGYAPGGEAYPQGWNLWMIMPNSIQAQLATAFYRSMVYQDPTWTPQRFELDKDWAAGRARVGALIDADKADPRAFFGHGGKLILYHGWSDAALSPENTIALYEALGRRAGAQAPKHMRLFMAPGMQHCSLGDGPSVFDAVGALDTWVDQGKAPEQMIATKFDNPMAGMLGQPAKALVTRPLCAWPKVARWDGKGSPDMAASFSCAAPPKAANR